MSLESKNIATILCNQLHKGDTKGYLIEPYLQMCRSLLLLSGEQILRADAEEKGRDWTAKAKDMFIPHLEFKFDILYMSVPLQVYKQDNSIIRNL